MRTTPSVLYYSAKDIKFQLHKTIIIEIHNIQFKNVKIVTGKVQAPYTDLI